MANPAASKKLTSVSRATSVSPIFNDPAKKSIASINLVVRFSMSDAWLLTGTSLDRERIFFNKQV